MKGAEVISKLSSILNGEELIVSSNGNVSRQVYHLLQGDQVYLRGSMGLPVPIGLGLALAQPKKTVLVITGDGNFLMGLSAMTTVAHVKPNNLKIIILDNELYATTGGQETVSSAIDYHTMIYGMGIDSVKSYDMRDDENMITEMLKDTLQESGLKILHLQVEEDTIPLDNIPHHPTKIKDNFV
ncbi:MAG: thiamine pyrophosphate-dependent enzyme, partial [Candidatus Heimdallarchaeaceae archaeon]